MLCSLRDRGAKASSQASYLYSCWLLWWKCFNARATAFHARWVKVGNVLINGLGNLLSQQARACVEQNGSAHQLFDKRFGLFVSHRLLLGTLPFQIAQKSFFISFPLWEPNQTFSMFA